MNYNYTQGGGAMERKRQEEHSKINYKSQPNDCERIETKNISIKGKLPQQIAKDKTNEFLSLKVQGKTTWKEGVSPEVWLCGAVG